MTSEEFKEKNNQKITLEGSIYKSFFTKSLSKPETTQQEIKEQFPKNRQFIGRNTGYAVDSLTRLLISLVEPNLMN